MDGGSKYEYHVQGTFGKTVRTSRFSARHISEEISLRRVEKIRDAKSQVSTLVRGARVEKPGDWLVGGTDVANVSDPLAMEIQQENEQRSEHVQGMYRGAESDFSGSTSTPALFLLLASSTFRYERKLSVQDYVRSTSTTLRFRGSRAAASSRQTGLDTETTSRLLLRIRR